MSTWTPTDAADSPPVSNESRGRAIHDRRVALGVISIHQFEEAVRADGLSFTRATLTRAEEGDASRNTYEALESWLTRQEVENGMDSAPAEVGPVRIEMHGVYGVEEIIAVGDPDQVADAVSKILERLKSQNE